VAEARMQMPGTTKGDECIQELREPAVLRSADQSDE
jgi:hypothetical protein